MKNEQLIRYLNGEASAADIRHVEEWRNKSARNQALFNDYRNLRQKEQQASELSRAELEHDWATVCRRIGFSNARGRTGDSLWPAIARIAAVIAVIFVVSGMLYTYWNVPGFGRWSSFETGASIDSLQLPDNSMVYLNRHSELTYRTGFPNEKRIVTLRGEGYFEVNPDLKRPFRVMAGNHLTVQVLGTAFHMNTGGSIADFELNVTEGVVSLHHHEHSREVPAGRRAIVNGSGIEVQPVVSTNFIAWKTGQLDFSNSSLTQIIEVLKKNFTQIREVHLLTQSEVLVNTRFENQSLNEVLQELELHFDKKFRFVDGVLTISD